MFSANAQEDASVDAQVGKIAESVASYKPSTFLEAAEALKPIVKQNPEYWIPAYYEALFEINYATYAPKSSDAQRLLDDAQVILDKIITFDGADKSEIYTLYGMLNLASGRHFNYFSSDVAGNFFKAIILNPTNPRPWLLLMIYSRQVWGAKDFDCSMEMEVIRNLFNKQQITGLSPSWGKDMVSHD